MYFATRSGIHLPIEELNDLFFQVPEDLPVFHFIPRVIFHFLVEAVEGACCGVKVLHKTLEFIIGQVLS